jgi:release factor glutamine methyltransferase
MNPTLKEAYDEGRKLLQKSDYSGSPSLDARVILCHALGITAEHFYAHGNDLILDEDQYQHYLHFLRLRLAHLPVAYITGTKEFMGIPFAVDRSVLIPRPATETLVEEALACLEKSDTGRPPRAADLGCGSGNVAISLAFYHPAVTVSAVDISPQALKTARKNLMDISDRFPPLKIDGRVAFYQGDLYGPLPRKLQKSLDLIVSNPPYVFPSEWASLMDGVRLYEPREALVPPEGVGQIYGRIAAGAAEFLRPGGSLTVEIGHSQASLVEGIFREAGFIGVSTKKDEEGFDRVVSGLVVSGQ